VPELCDKILGMSRSPDKQPPQKTPTADELYAQLNEAFTDPEIEQAIRQRRTDIQESPVQTVVFVPPELILPYRELGTDRREQIKKIIEEKGVGVFLEMFFEDMHQL